MYLLSNSLRGSKLRWPMPTLSSAETRSAKDFRDQTISPRPIMLSPAAEVHRLIANCRLRRIRAGGELSGASALVGFWPAHRRQAAGRHRGEPAERARCIPTSTYPRRPPDSYSLRCLTAHYRDVPLASWLRLRNTRLHQCRGAMKSTPTPTRGRWCDRGVAQGVRRRVHRDGSQSHRRGFI